MKVDDLIEALGLEPLPVEGGLYRQTYVSDEHQPAGALPERYREDKPFSTLIYYLLTDDSDSFSALHRLPTDEVYHFYLGDPVELLQLFPDGRSERVILGHGVTHGERVQHVAPRGVWQGSRLIRGGRFALMGTSMAPGFTQSDYEGGERDALIARYPDEEALITSLTRPGAELRMGGSEAG